MESKDEKLELLASEYQLPFSCKFRELTGNDILYTRELYTKNKEQTLTLQEKIKRRKKQHKRIKKQQRQKKIEKGKKKKQLRKKIDKKCIEVWGCNLDDKFARRVTFANGDFQSLREETKKVCIFKGRKKCHLIASYLDWGSWGSMEIDYYLHKPSGWILSLSKADTRNSCCDNQDVYFEEEWSRSIEVTEKTHLYFI